MDCERRCAMLLEPASAAHNGHGARAGEAGVQLERRRRLPICITNFRTRTRGVAPHIVVGGGRWLVGDGRTESVESVRYARGMA